jgi:hypothetical protein
MKSTMFLAFRSVVHVGCVLALAASSSASAASPTSQPAGSDWPHWLGPNRDGTSPEKNLLRQWPAEGPKVLWRVPIERGWSCPSVSGGDIILTSKKSVNWKSSDEIVQCLDAKDGHEKWHYTYRVESYNRVGHPWGGPRSTPAVTDRFVYAIGMVGHALCLDRKTGQVVWKTSIADDIFPYALRGEQKGFNQSPVILDGVIGLSLKQGRISRERKDGEASRDQQQSLRGRRPRRLGKTGPCPREGVRPHAEGADMPQSVQGIAPMT